jgi:3-methyladenine DNA glycosylase AlkD
MAKLKPAKKPVVTGKKKLNAAPSRSKPDKEGQIDAAQFLKRLKTYQSAAELKKIQRYFKSEAGEYGEGDIFIGVRMGQVFALAKEFMNMAPGEIEKLLESPIHEARVGAVSIMDFQARSKKITESRRKELFDLYISRHDRINNWDLVDRSAPYVVGGYLSDKPRGILYKLARSKNIWERRTSIVSTYYFIRQGDVDDTFKIAELLLFDKEDLIHKAAGGWIRFAGGKDPKKLIGFLDAYAATMPRTMLRYAIERLPKKQREYYLGLKHVK